MHGFLRLACLISIFVWGAQLAHAEPEFVGGAVCAGCHEAQHAQWSGSHHDLSMQAVSPETVLGNFDDQTVVQFGVPTQFSRRGDEFVIRTEGPEGEQQDFTVAYVFGVSPLQQYLIELPGGRLQAFSLAWDTRAAEEGGQRWFHLYPDQKIAFDDELHWTKPSQNWNSMCADCHSTNLRKQYDARSRTFDTQWSEIDVSCEACHGPGSQHVGWANREEGWQSAADTLGLVQRFDERDGVTWQFGAADGIARRSVPKGSDKEIEMCARCHSRRSPISNDYIHGQRLMDHYMPRRLDAGMYFPDGQIHDEVFVYGSFIQSKMYHAGVTCSDCHQPHSNALKFDGNAVCTQCHDANRFDTEKHHFHTQNTAGASCAECHMPARNYMVIDARHDHSMRIPRPDLSVQLGTPNACTNCHTDQQPAWAARQVEDWYGHTPSGYQNFAKALASLDEVSHDTGRSLAGVVRDEQAPDIARATALSALAPYLAADNLDVMVAGLSDDNPLIRAAAVVNLEQAPSDVQYQYAWPLLSDPVRGVRIETARVLADYPAATLDASDRAIFEAASREYIESQWAMAERPQAQANIGNHFFALGSTEGAIAAYREAIAIDARFVPGFVNLADVYRAVGDENNAESVLREGLQDNPESSVLHRVLGLSLVRQGRTDEAVGSLRLAAQYGRAEPSNAYVYAIALNSNGQSEEAIAVLKDAARVHPTNREILSALVSLYRDAGQLSDAMQYIEQLRALDG